MFVVVFTREGKNDFNKLENKLKKRIVGEIDSLKDNERDKAHLPLGYIWKGFFKLRVGGWRIIYELERKEKKNYNSPY